MNEKGERRRKDREGEERRRRVEEGKGGRGREEDFRALPQFQICHSTTAAKCVIIATSVIQTDAITSRRSQSTVYDCEQNGFHMLTRYDAECVVPRQC